MAGPLETTRRATRLAGLAVAVTAAGCGAAPPAATSPATVPPPSAALPVPDVRQSTDYTCSASALQAVLAYYGIEELEADLSRELGATPEDGAPPEAIVRVARAHGLTAELREHMTIADLAAALARRQPVIVDLQAWTDADEVDWATDWDDGHYVVLIAIEGDRLVFEDPSILGSRGVMTRAALEARWHDVDKAQRHDHAGIVLGGRTPAPPPARIEIE